MCRERGARDLVVNERGVLIGVVSHVGEKVVKRRRELNTVK
jgi:hypothetical protein